MGPWHRVNRVRTSRHSRIVAIAAAALIGLCAAVGPLAAVPVSALGVILVVDTTSDDIYPADNGCSLRAAILASNNGSVAGNCGSGSTDTDRIQFSLGSGVPVINIATDLPTITDPVNIVGNTGGATRVELRGPGTGTGLHLASASVIRGLAIDNFRNGVQMDDGGTIAGNVIGPNSHFGIYAPAGGAIGGTTGVTPHGPCSGDCNLVSGNGAAGLFVAGGGTIAGNFVGTTANGRAANGNDIGITVSGGYWTIGGSGIGAGNLVSGNTHYGLNIHSCPLCLIQGNHVGTNAKGSAAIANGSSGLWLSGSDSSMAIGNVISGNGGAGIELSSLTSVRIQGNLIGTKNGGAPLGNGGSGIWFDPTGQVRAR